MNDLDINKVNELKRKLKDVLDGEIYSNGFYSLRWVMIEYCNSYINSTEGKKKKDKIVEDYTDFVSDMIDLFGLKFTHYRYIKQYQRHNMLNKINLGLCLLVVALNLFILLCR